MSEQVKGPLVLGALVCLGLLGMGYLLGSSAIRFKEYERFVTVKGLAEREVAADVVVWPIRFSGADQDLSTLYAHLQKDGEQVLQSLLAHGFAREEVTIAPPAVTDKLAQQYGNAGRVELRYTGNQTITVYTSKIDLVRGAQEMLVDLGKKGIVIGGAEFGQRPEFLFTKLNDLKPAMIEEATRKAREVAAKFAADSHSSLGKIRSANQGQFTVADRDSNTPHVKNVRVVSTLEYYLSD